MEKRQDLGKRCGGIESESGKAARFADADESFGYVVVGFDVNRDAIGSGGDEAREVVIGS